MEDTYNIYRNGVKVKSGLTEKTYTDSGLTPATLYRYQISAQNEAGESPKTPELEVTTLPVAVTGVTADPTSGSVKVGATLQVNASVSPADATDKTVTYASSDETIATVDGNGLATGVKAGTANITVTSHADNTKKATFALTVTAA